MGTGHAHALYVHEHSPIHHLPPQVKIAAAVTFIFSVAVTPREAMWAFAIYAGVIAALVVIPVGFLSISILDPNVEVWRQQWDTRLPNQLIETFVLLAGVSVGTLLLGFGLAWLVSAYRFPGSRFFGWTLIAPLAMPSYVLGFVTLSVTLVLLRAPAR